jgi:arginase family enzyme
MNGQDSNYFIIIKQINSWELPKLDCKDTKFWNGQHKPNPDSSNTGITVLGLPFDQAISCREGAAEAPDRIRSISTHIKGKDITQSCAKITDEVYQE